MSELPFTEHYRDLNRPPARPVGDLHVPFFQDVETWGGVSARDAAAALTTPELARLIQDHYLLHSPSLIGGIITLGPWGQRHVHPDRQARVTSSTEAINHVYMREGIKQLITDGYTYAGRAEYHRHWMLGPEGRVLVLGRCVNAGFSPRAIRSILKQHRAYLMSERATLLVFTPDLRRLRALTDAEPMVAAYGLPISAFR
ncbi:hypothetical protein [Deinococcus sp. PEB2-63]